MPSISELRWCVGKFVYPKGGTNPMHFMPLHDFHLEEALNVAAIVSLRTQRLGGGKGGVGSAEISRWLDMTAAWTLAGVAADLLDGAEEKAEILEYDPGHGLLFEAIKLIVAQRGQRRFFHYTGVGPDHMRIKFNLLHGREDPVPRYVASTGEGARCLTIVNQANGMRYRPSSLFAIEDLIARVEGAALLALRVVDGGELTSRTTILGHSVTLSGVDSILASLRKRGDWYYRYIEGHDAEYLLPQEGPRAGLLIAYRQTGSRDPIARFRSANMES
jgi:hypothetical protein